MTAQNVQGLRNKQTEAFQAVKDMGTDICLLTETKKKEKGNGKVTTVYIISLTQK